MRLGARDAVAAGAVVFAGLLYGLWVFDSAPWGLGSLRMTGVAVLVLGLIACAGNSVPGIGQLLRGNRAYLAVTALMGLAALAGGLWMLIPASEAGLGLLVGATGVLWVISTVHHGLLARATVRTMPVSAGVHVPSVEKREAA